MDGISAIQNIFQTAQDRCAARRSEVPCAPYACQQDKQCPVSCRRLLHQLWRATEDCFRSQQEAMKYFASQSHLEKHVEEHSDLALALSEILARQSTSPSCHEVFSDLERWSEKLVRHGQTTDTGVHAGVSRVAINQSQPVDEPRKYL